MFKKGLFLRVFFVVALLGLVLTGCTNSDLDQQLTSPTEGAIAQVEAQAQLKVHFIDVGQGDAILIQAPTGETMLIDGGERYTWVADKLLGYLRSQGVTRINTMVATHPHSDHIGGLNAVLQNVPVYRVYDSGKSSTSSTYSTFLNLISQKNIPYYLARRGNYIWLADGLYIQVLNPGSDANSQETNNASVVLRMTYKNMTFILTGDAEVDAEAAIVNSGYYMDGNVLKVGHHGSSTSSSNAFLDKVTPQVAVISVGEDNVYNHPASTTLSKLSSRGIPYYMTKDRGDIVISTDGYSYSVSY